MWPFYFQTFCCNDERSGKGGSKKGVFLFWQTKSAVQPLGNSNEWKKMKQLPEQVKVWASKGKATSLLRSGSVNVSTGNRRYRHLMTSIVRAENHLTEASM